MPSLDRNLSMLFTLNLAVSISTQLIQPLFPLYLEGLHATEMEIGLVIALSSLAATALMLPSGLLIDRVGKRRMLLLSVILATFPTAILSVVGDWRMVIPFSMILNASFSFFIPARMALIAESATPENRATLFGLMNIAWPIGGIVSPVMSGYLVERFGWSLNFLVSAAIIAVSIIPTALLREERAEPAVTASDAPRVSLLDRRYLPSMVLFFAFHFVMTTGIGGFNMILPLFLKNRFHLSYSFIGLFFTSTSVVTLLTQIPSGYLSDRYGRKRLLVACIAAIPILIGVWPLIDSWILLMVLFTAAFGLWSMTWPSTLALLSDSVPAEVIGTAFGVRMTGIRLGFTVGPILAGFLYSAHGSSAPFLAAALFHLLGIPLALLFRDNQGAADEIDPQGMETDHPAEKAPPSAVTTQKHGSHPVSNPLNPGHNDKSQLD
ncbi:MAG: MFS transporter [Candidatus Bathyarchaeota archaeon]|nr:MFS transporter [Candidatus Bathyarchaeota archaeon]